MARKDGGGAVVVTLTRREHLKDHLLAGESCYCSTSQRVSGRNQSEVSLTCGVSLLVDWFDHV
jgi:hypothetical protein